MPGFESPISNRKFAAQPMRNIEIPDETGYHSNQLNMEELQNFQSQVENTDLAEIEKQIKKQREERARGQTSLNEGAKKRIEMLIGMTRLTKTINIEGNEYTLQTLKSKEMRQAILNASRFDQTVQSPFEIRKQLLAYSLVQIAGVTIEQFVGSNLFQDKLDLIDELDDALLNRLLDEYSLLNQEAKNKYSLKNVEEAKELSEDLKK